MTKPVRLLPAARIEFDYIVLYREDLDEILVISVFHTSRAPSIWRDRL